MVMVFSPGWNLFQGWLTETAVTPETFDKDQTSPPASLLPTGRTTDRGFPAAPGVRAGRVGKVGEEKEMFPPFSDKWVVWHRLQVTVQNGCLWAESTVRRKRGAWTKSDRCTGEMKIQKLFAFVVIRHTHTHTHTESLLQSNLHDRILAISVTVLVMRGSSSF